MWPRVETFVSGRGKAGATRKKQLQRAWPKIDWDAEKKDKETHPRQDPGLSEARRSLTKNRNCKRTCRTRYEEDCRNTQAVADKAASNWVRALRAASKR